MSRGGRRSRDKGNRAERAIVRFLQEHSFAAERVPLSGSAGGRYVGDVTVPVIGRDLLAEVKCRADGFRELYAWLDGAYTSRRFPISSETFQYWSEACADASAKRR